MTKQVLIVYDDTRIPNNKIKSITGGKSFGETIFKRQTLRDRMKEYFERIPEVCGFVDSQVVINTNAPIVCLYSDFVISDEEAILVIVRKALYAHECYKVVVNGRVACVIFPSLEQYVQFSGKPAVEEFATIVAEGLCDISDVINFRSFITSGFEARFFNSVSGDEYTVVKSSDNIKKLKAEYTYYSLVPDNMKQWFVMPYDYIEKDNVAQYSMQRYHMTDLAIRYVHGAIDKQEFANILDKLFRFIEIRKQRKVDADEYEKCAKSLYVDKVIDRIEQLKGTEKYSEIARLIESATCYSSIDDIVQKYLKLYESIRKDRKFMNVQVIGHGDLCFSNILYSDEASLIKLIDTKGALTEDELYMDPYYDIAKLSHSICGHYDFYNSDRFEISLDDELKAHLFVDANNREYVELFKGKLEQFGIDFKLVRMYEASLFLSMLPLHMDRPKKVFAFVLNAIAILESLEE